MSYLLDKKIKRRKTEKVILVTIAIILFFFFRNSIFKGFSFAFHFVSRPFLVLGNNIGNGFENLGVYFNTQKNLYLENEVLKFQLKENEAKMSNYNSVLDENEKMKEMMKRKNIGENFVLSVILAKPNRSFYDTLIIDTGLDDGISPGKRVFAYGYIPIGFVSEVYQNSAKIVLYSSPGEKTDVIISGSDVFIQIIGRGGGDFEMILPRDFSVQMGNEVVLPGIKSFVVAKIEKIISDPHDSFQKVLLKSPTNIFELKSVEVEK